VTLGIETGGRINRQFHNLIAAKFKADADAGPQDSSAQNRRGSVPEWPQNRISDPLAKATMPFFARTISSFMGRIQVARVKCVAKRIIQSRTPDVPAVTWWCLVYK
jgi:hypothetical protein